MNLITNVQTKNVSAPDNGFLEKAITDSQENVLSGKINNVHADGAYHSLDNQIFATKEQIELYLTGMQGKPPRYTLIETEQGLQVTDTQTSEVQIAYQTEKESWRIKTEKGYRYFTQKDIDAAILRKELKNIPPKKKKKRNNVEATVFQYSFHTRNNKTRYRGLIKHKIFAFARCLWVNLVRITNYEIKICQGAL